MRRFFFGGRKTTSATLEGGVSPAKISTGDSGGQSNVSATPVATPTLLETTSSYLSSTQPSGICVRERLAFRDWYVANFCSAVDVSVMARLQNTCLDYERPLTKYFEFLSLFGEPPFYTFFIPFFFWIGLTKEAALFCVMMSLTIYAIDNVKDLFACPRPPCPPLRRAGKESHALEYGFPSCHVGLGMMCAFHICRCCALLLPEYSTLIWVGGAWFVVLTAVSRVYLGLHWIGDIMGGVVVFGAVFALQEAFIARLILRALNSETAPWYIFIISHVLTRFCATPWDPCPCYEDTVRFLGAGAGAIFGCWMAEHHYTSIVDRSRLPRNEQLALLTTGDFWKRAVIGIVFIAVLKTLLSVLLPPALKYLYLTLNGSKHDAVPKPFRPLYNFVCSVMGYLLLAPRVPASHTPLEDDCEAATTTSLSESAAALGGGAIWQVKIHQYWWLWDVHAKSIAYISVPLAASYLMAPLVAMLGIEP